MVEVKPPLTDDQRIALAIVPKFTAAFSIIGSGYIIGHVLLSRNRRKRVYHRILLGMGLMDIISSLKFFLTTWPLPEGIAWGARGTTQTCTAAGFFGHGAGLAGPLYNGSLTLYYFLTIRDRARWREERIRSIEPWLHAVPLAIGWSTAIAGLPLKLYNPFGWTCWIGPWPPGCQQTYKFGQTTCIRGDNADIYRWAFFHGELWLTFILIFLGMAFIYQTVERADRMTGNSRSPDASRNMSADENEGARRSWLRHHQGKHARKIMVQAALFVAAFYITWIFPAIAYLTIVVRGETYTIVLFLKAFFVPLQGAFNALIYLRPRYLRNRERRPEEGIRRALWRTLRSEALRSRYGNRGSVSNRDSIGPTSGRDGFPHGRHSEDSWWMASFMHALQSRSVRNVGEEGRNSSGGRMRDELEGSCIKSTLSSQMGMEDECYEETLKCNEGSKTGAESGVGDKKEAEDREELCEELVD